MRYLAAFLMIFLIGCRAAVTESGVLSDDDAPQEPAIESVEDGEAEPEEAQPEVVPQPEDIAEPMSIEDNIIVSAADGRDIVGTFYAGNGEAPWPGVVLLHMLGSNRQAWRDYGPQLAQAGYASLAIDMRGHGDTGGSRDWVQAEDDILLARAYLASRPDVDESRIAIIGGSIGANMALRAAALEPAIDTTVLLSPGLNYAGVTTEDAVLSYGERPILIAASEGDSAAASSSRTLDELAVGQSQLQIFDGGAHGTGMLGQVPGLEDMIAEWLNQHVQ